MRVATSPGMRRMRAKTRTLTRKSVGIARARRRSRYCFTAWAAARARRRLLVEPRVEQAHAEPVAVVMAEALHVGRVRHVLGPLRHVDVVRLVGQIALDVVHDLPAL